MRIVFSEPDFEDDACHASRLHILGQRKSGIERVQLNDPLVDVADEFRIKVPAKLVEWS
jgi:hypothetical protein